MIGAENPENEIWTGLLSLRRIFALSGGRNTLNAISVFLDNLSSFTAAEGDVREQLQNHPVYASRTIAPRRLGSDPGHLSLRPHFGAVPV